jgi:hypothetical protein
MNLFIRGMALAMMLQSVLAADSRHLDIMVPDLKDTDLSGPVKSVKVDVCRNVSGIHTTEKREFDPVGNLTRISEWDADGKLIETTTFAYDADGSYESMHYENKEDEIDQAWTVILNPETRQIALREKEGFIALETYSDERYLLSYQLMSKEKKQLLAYEHKRNDSNRETELTYIVDRKPVYTYFFKWGENGFIEMERQRYHQERAEFLHTYEYLVNDDYGNWTQRILVRYRLDSGRKEKVYEHTVVREIEYFQENPEPEEGESHE